MLELNILLLKFFYDNQYYYRLVREARKIGIHVPILAGIMPAHNPKQLKNIAKMSNCSVPFDLAAMIDRFAGNPKSGKGSWFTLCNLSNHRFNDSWCRWNTYLYNE